PQESSAVSATAVSADSTAVFAGDSILQALSELDLDGDPGEGVLLSGEVLTDAGLQIRLGRESVPDLRNDSRLVFESDLAAQLDADVPAGGMRRADPSGRLADSFPVAIERIGVERS